MHKNKFDIKEGYLQYAKLFALNQIKIIKNSAQLRNINLLDSGIRDFIGVKKLKKL